MNKKTILALLLTANLYGHMASAHEVIVSERRLQNISASELSILVSQGAVRIHDNKAVLNIRKLDSMLRDPFQAQSLAKEAQKTATRFVPYGQTDDEVSIEHKNLVDALTTRFVPYGNT